MPRINRGFSVAELLVVIAVLAVFGAIAVAAFGPAFRTSSFGQAFDTLVADVETRHQRAATTGRDVVYRPEAELLREQIVTVNPTHVPPPPGFAVSGELRFQAATGRVLGADGEPQATAVILSCDGDPQIAAVCINRSGVITTLQYQDSSWRPR